MVRGRYKQLLLAQLVLFGTVTSPEDLMDPVLRRIDDALDDEASSNRYSRLFASVAQTADAAADTGRRPKSSSECWS
jgi:hypothetical protein